MNTPDPRVRPLVQLILDEAHRYGRRWDTQAVHAGVVNLLNAGRSSAAVLAAATGDARDPNGGPLRWPQHPEGWTPSNVQDLLDARCEVCGLTRHACLRLHQVVAVEYRHTYVPRRRPTGPSS